MIEKEDSISLGDETFQLENEKHDENEWEIFQALKSLVGIYHQY